MDHIAGAMSSRRSLSIRSVVLFSTGLLIGCERQPSLTIHVKVGGRTDGRVEVAMALTDASSKELTVRGFAAMQVLDVSEFSGTDSSGAPIEVESTTLPITIDSRKVRVPRFRLKTRSPDLTIRYLVRPGAREGDEHLGFNGRAYGYMGEDFAFLTGRNLFLLPEPAESLQRIRVTLSVPDGWNVANPWKREGEYWVPGIDGQYAAEHLVTASIGLGPFDEEVKQIGATRYRFAIYRGIPDAERTQSVSRLDTIARYVHEIMNRDLGPDYVTIVVPKASHGDDILGEGWGAGQGGTLVPATATRLETFARRLLEAHIRYAPFRVEFQPEEFWLGHALIHWYSVTALQEVESSRRDEIARTLNSAFLDTLREDGLDRNLERLRAPLGSRGSAQEVLAPFALMHLDRQLRTKTGDAMSIDTLVPHLMRGRRAGSVWPRARAAGIDTVRFRESYVTGDALPPITEFQPLVSANRVPVPSRGKRATTVVVAYTGKTAGYLESCGCKTNQSGGIARRATYLRRIRDEAPDAVVLDAGDAFVRPKEGVQIDFLSSEEQAVYLESLVTMRYDAVAVGETELSLGLDHFKKFQRRALRYVTCNVSEDGVPIVVPEVILERRGIVFAVIGVFEPPHGKAAPRSFEENTAALDIADPVATLRERALSLKDRADIVVALGRLTPTTARRIAREIPEVNLIISSEYTVPTQSSSEGDSKPISNEDEEGFFDQTLVLYAHLTSYGVGVARLGLDAERRIASVELSDQWLDESIPDDPQIRVRLNSFYDRVGRLAASQGSVGALFPDDTLRLTGVYAGESACASCHVSEHAQWKGTKHADAFKTLLDRHRHFQPRCVSCHVVGFGTRHGYKLGGDGRLVNVQCEVCHGPGADHVREPRPENIRRVVPETVCVECHNPSHSDHFEYDTAINAVLHTVGTGLASSPPGGGH